MWPFKRKETKKKEKEASWLCCKRYDGGMHNTHQLPTGRFKMNPSNCVLCQSCQHRRCDAGC
ncbi:hypothetical protein DL95DRAFT_387631, partial [Leptodontidium sp. 2 PMI_412]